MQFVEGNVVWTGLFRRYRRETSFSSITIHFAFFGSMVTVTVLLG